MNLYQHTVPVYQLQNLVSLQQPYLYQNNLQNLKLGDLIKDKATDKFEQF